MVKLTASDLIDYLVALIAVDEIVESEFEVLNVGVHETDFFDTIGVLINAPCEH